MISQNLILYKYYEDNVGNYCAKNKGSCFCSLLCNESHVLLYPLIVWKHEIVRNLWLIEEEDITSTSILLLNRLQDIIILRIMF